MDPKATVFPEDNQARLKELGLSEPMLLRVVGQGLMAWANCSENDPPTYPGFVAWGTTVRALREELASGGWRKDDTSLSLVVNEDDSVAILVARGDDGTGDAGKHVSTKRSRGPKTFEQVQINRGQLRLFTIHGNEIPLSHHDDRQVWMLLYHRDLRAREVRCELSLPISMGDDSRPDEWSERIILDTIPFDDDINVPTVDDDPLGPDIEVPVEKRG